MSVKTKDYARQYEALWAELEPRLREAFMTANPILGEPVTHFEHELARFHGVTHAVGTGSGTDALILGLEALDVRGKDVLLCSHNFPGVVSAVLLAGGRPVLVEPELATGRMTAAQVAAHLGPKAGCILAVHLYGHPLDLEGLVALSRETNVPLLEDCAQAHGARYAGTPVGSHGHLATLSFHPSKNLGAFGDGGAILTHDAHLAEHLRVARNLGKSDKYRFDAIARNSKLDTLQAVLLSLKLKHLPHWVLRRHALATRYLKGLASLTRLHLPVIDPKTDPAWHLFVIRTEERDALRSFLEERGVKTSLHYPIAIPDHPAFASHFAGQPFPVARTLARTVLTLPLSHEHEENEIDHVITCLQDYEKARP